MHIKSGTKGSNAIGGPMETFWGQSPVSVSDAIQQAVSAANLQLGPGTTLEWLELIETRGGFDNGILQFQVVVRIGYIPSTQP